MPGPAEHANDLSTVLLRAGSRRPPLVSGKAPLPLDFLSLEDRDLATHDDSRDDRIVGPDRDLAHDDAPRDDKVRDLAHDDAPRDDHYIGPDRAELAREDEEEKAARRSLCEDDLEGPCH